MAINPVDVLPITLRERIPQSAIENVIAQIVENFQPQQIILFGSYAYGNPRPESDVDLLVVMETQLSEIQQAIEILQSIQYRFGLDLIVFSPQRLTQRLKWGDPFLKEITVHGKLVYESPGS